MLGRGDQVGKYEIVGQVGRGGMGLVYKARDTDTGDLAAVKIPAPEIYAQDGLRRQFFLEGKALSRANHPHVVKVLTVQDSGNAPFIAMEYLSGRTLSETIAQDGPLTMAATISILRPLADALDYLHDLKPQIIHRDVKPGNIRFRESQPVLLDLGIVQIEGATIVAGAGRWEYASPEQLDGERVDGRSDQYSLAAVAYEMLTGKVVFDGPPLAVLRQIEIGPLLSGALSDSVRAVLGKALSHDPQGRFNSCLEFTEALDEASAGRISATLYAKCSVPKRHGDSRMPGGAVWAAELPLGRRVLSEWRVLSLVLSGILFVAVALLVVSPLRHIVSPVVAGPFRTSSASKANGFDGNRLAHAIETNDAELFAAELAKGSTQVGLGLQDGATARENSLIHTAAWVGSVAILRVLLDRGVPVDFHADSGETPLVIAAAYGKPDAAQLLVERGADVNGGLCSAVGSPLMAASFEGNFDIVRLLVDNRASVDQSSNIGGVVFSPLARAAGAGRKEIAQYLLKHGAIATRSLAESVRKDHPDIAVLLRNEDPNAQLYRINAEIQQVKEERDAVLFRKSATPSRRRSVMQASEERLGELGAQKAVYERKIAREEADRKSEIACPPVGRKVSQPQPDALAKVWMKGLLEQANQAHEGGDYEKAIARCQAVLQLNSGNQDAVACIQRAQGAWDSEKRNSVR